MKELSCRLGINREYKLFILVRSIKYGGRRMNNLDKIKTNKDLWKNLVIAVETKKGLKRVDDIYLEIPAKVSEFLIWAEE